MALSRPDGRYVLSGLRPGQYSLRYSDCASPGRYAAPASAEFGWPGQAARQTVIPGQVRDLPTVSLGPVTPAPRPGARLRGIRTGAAAPAGTGEMRGVVRGNGHPVAGVCVRAFPLRSGFIYSTTTSASGSYTLRRVTAGRYQVEFASTDSCPDPGNWLSQWYKGITTPFPTTTATVIRVGKGTVTRGIDASLRRGGEISGTITSRSGQPLSGICVTVQGRVTGGFTEAIPTTGKHGKYVAHGLFQGSYVVGFKVGCGSTGNYSPQWWRHAAASQRATRIRIIGTRHAAHVDAVLAPGSAIAGVVRAGGPSGPPLRGICVDAFNAKTGISADTRTSRTGSYRLIGLAGGSYEVQYQVGCGNDGNYRNADKAVTVRAGHTRRGVNAFLKQGAGLSGVVSNTRGKPVGGICVQISDTHGDNSEAETGPDGSYRVTGVPGGSYKVQFSGGCGNTGSYIPQYYNGKPTADEADPVVLTAGHVMSGINATMQPGGIVAGVLTDPAGHRLSGVCVGIATLSDQLLGDGEFADIEFTSNGRFRAQNLMPGIYSVNFGCGIGAFASQWFRSHSSAADADLVSVGAGQITSGIGAVLQPAGSISGVVTDHAGQRLSLICALAIPAGGPYPAVIGGPGMPVTRSGSYRIGHLTAGRYDVQFSSCDGGRYGSQWYRGKPTQQSGTQVRVRTGRTTEGINDSLALGGSISGRIVGNSGRPKSNYCVEAYDAAAQSFGLAVTSRTGDYVITGLSSGSYLIFILSCTGNEASTTRPGVVRVIAPHAVTGISERLPSAGSISGTVVAGPHAPVTQANICVVIVPVRRNGSYGYAFTGTDGSYRVAGLAPGEYQVNFADPFCFFGTMDLAQQWYSNQLFEASADKVAVTVGGDTSGIDATLAAGSRISGTVTGPSHGPVAGECVTAVPIGAAPDPLLGVLPPHEIAVTRGNGSYSLVGVQPGGYQVEFTAGCGDSGFQTQWWDNAGSAASATVVTVGAGATVTGIDAALKH